MDLPTITIMSHVTDEDEDLTGYSILVKFDDGIDGVLSDDAEELSVSGALQGELCAVPEADIGVRLYLRGGPHFQVPLMNGTSRPLMRLANGG